MAEPHRPAPTPTARTLLSPPLLAWGLYLFATPFYVFKSGLPQPGDMLALLVIPLSLYGWDGRLPALSAPPVRMLAGFVAWTFAVSMAWALYTGRFGLGGPDNFVMLPVYYLYNSLVVLSALVLYRRFGRAFLRMTFFATLLTVGFLVAAAVVVGRDAPRGSLFFENPNQLGFFALLSACMVVLLSWRLENNGAYVGFGLVGCSFLAVVSASRAAVVGVALLVMLVMFTSRRALLVASVLTVIAGLIGTPVSSAIDVTERRDLAVRRTTGFVEERRYDRLWTHPEYLLLGAGEGGLYRFASVETPRPIEIHSSPATVLFSYGLVGLLLIGAFLRRLVAGARLRLSLVLLPPIAYTLAHQGLRFTLLWLLFGLFAVVKAEPNVIRWFEGSVLARLRRGDRLQFTSRGVK